MDPKKKKIQTAKDYEVQNPKSKSKAITLTPFPLTPQKTQQPLQNRFSPIQNQLDIPFKTVLASNLPKPANVELPNSSEVQSYVSKEWHENCGMTSFTEMPSSITQRDYVRNLFPNPSQMWESDDFLKDQRYYELILIDSNSVEITHNYNRTKDVEFSKCIIKKIHTFTTFGGSQEFKEFSVNHPAQGYHYMDYKNAWFRAFYLRPFNHSWFFAFHHSSDRTFPTWFIDWWMNFGSVKKILPPEIQNGFNLYAELSSLKNFQKFITFHSDLKIPWIFAWDFHFKKIFPDPVPYSLIRVFKVKWWIKFQEHLGNESSVRHFLTTGQRISYQKEGKGKETKNASSSKPSNEPDLSGLPEFMRKEFYEFLAQRSTSSVTKSEESVSSDPIGGQDPFDF